MKRISLVLLALVSSLAFADGHKGLDWDTALSGDHRSESTVVGTNTVTRVKRLSFLDCRQR